jgi:hypothetical protein
MGKKKMPAPALVAAKAKAKKVPIRLELSEEERDRMLVAAKRRGLSLAAFARQAVLLLVAADLREDRK